MKKEIKFYAITSVLQATEKDALYAIKSPTDTTFRLAVTDLGGTVVYLSESNLAITSTDGSIDISNILGAKDLKVSTALQNAINNGYLLKHDTITNQDYNSLCLIIKDLTKLMTYSLFPFMIFYN